MDVNKILEDITVASANTMNNISTIFDNMGITTSGDIKSQRLQICNTCDKLEKPLNRCKSCGCFMPVKAALTHAKCPINKW